MNQENLTSDAVVRGRSRPGGCRGFYAHKITDAQYIAKIKSKVSIDERGCWIWKGWKNWKGYGEMGYRNRSWFTHRLSYTLHIGPIPDGMQVLHRCDVRACCNPLHLFVGTNDDNMADKTRKGRHHAFRATSCPKGHPYDEQNTYWKKPSAKFKRGPARSCKKCAQIRSRLKLGWTLEQAESMPVTPAGHRPVNGRKR